MSILLFIESENNKLKRNAAEIASYGVALADKLNKDCVAVSFNADNAQELGQFGISKVFNVTNTPQQFDAHVYANVLTHYVAKLAATHIIVSSSADAKFLAPLIAANTNAAYVPNVVALPHEYQPLTVRRTAFTNKAFANTTLTAEVNIIGVGNNTFGSVEQAVDCVVENVTVEHTASQLEQLSISKETGKATIADADVVVSGGRGLKGPEHWHLIEELAEVLDAATACSKPVSDMGWRSHDEHVGQTGKPVSTNLYIAIGISGAIQHLAGVNASKVKVVINNDPEAPFFKAADYGIVGDAFEVVPVLTEKLKAFKAQS
ncbi:MAG: electron transfer flavoprotein subunit alpha/FixB family protein [Flavobacteriaceae bacterium]|nr:electron transfer flavoprotein subunit alpha/FixB family protein [Flavobacteriaceae bacterium]